MKSLGKLTLMLAISFKQFGFCFYRAARLGSRSVAPDWDVNGFNVSQAS